MSIIEKIKAKPATETIAAIAYALSFVVTGAVISDLLFTDFISIPEIISLAFLIACLWQLICLLLPDGRRFAKKILNYIFHLTLTTELVILINFSGIFDNDWAQLTLGDMFLSSRRWQPFLWDFVIMTLIVCVGLQALYFVARRAIKKSPKMSDDGAAGVPTLKGIRITKFKILAAMFIIGAVSVSITALLWFQHIKVFEPFLNSAKLEQIRFDSQNAPPEFVYIERINNSVPVPPRYSYWKDPWYYGGRWEMHRYTDFERSKGENGYDYHISVPMFLSFGGGIQITHSTELSGEGTFISFNISPVEMSYSMSITEAGYNWYDDRYAAGMRTDKDGRPLDLSLQHPETTEKEYRDFLFLQDKYADEVAGIVAAARDAFGDALK